MGLGVEQGLAYRGVQQGLAYRNKPGVWPGGNLEGMQSLNVARTHSTLCSASKLRECTATQWPIVRVRVSVSKSK